MPVEVNTFFEERLEQLVDLAQLVEHIFASAGLEYRIAGGLATYRYVEEAAPDAGRLTRDIDVVVRREDLARIADAAQAFGYRRRQVAGVDMLMKEGESSARRAVHLVFSGENVRPGYIAAVPGLGREERLRGLRLIPLADLIRMKLTSFRLKDQAHLKDLEEAGLIIESIEATWMPELRERLRRVRAAE